MSPESSAPASPSVRSLRDEAVAALARAGVPDPQVDAELLIGHVLGESRGRVQALVVMDATLGAEEAEQLRALVERRAAREPLQHITGRAPFRSLELAVGPGVFVPRPETEQVAQFAIDALRAVPSAEPIAVDLGTGQRRDRAGPRHRGPARPRVRGRELPRGVHLDPAQRRRDRRRRT